MANILLVEDEPISRRLYQKFLERDGHVVDTACDGAEALQKFESRTYEVVVTDLYMPDVSGLELIPKLRTLDKKVYIVAISGGGQLGNMDLGLGVARSLGADRILNKPFEPDALREAVALLIHS